MNKDYIEGVLKEFAGYLETNWQEMHGGDLVDVSPVGWLRTALENQLEMVREEIKSLRLTRQPSAEYQKHYLEGYNEALGDAISLLDLNIK